MNIIDIIKKYIYLVTCVQHKSIKIFTKTIQLLSTFATMGWVAFAGVVVY